VIYIITNLEWYKSFYFVVKTGSITKAAEQLYVTQPSVSYSIKQLEEHLGIQLFVRKSKGVRLTKEGEALFQHVETAFDSLLVGEKKMEQFKNLNRGEVKIGTSDTLCKYYLLPHIESFNKSYPDIKIHLSHGKTPDILGWLKDGRIDCGIVHLPINEEWFDVIEIATIQDCFVAGEKYKHLAESAQPLEEILKHPTIVLSKNSNTRNFIDMIAQRNGLTLVPEIELGSVDLLIEFARIGLGISFISKEFIAEQLDNKTLYELKVIEDIPSRKIGIGTLKNSPLSLSARKLVEELLSAGRTPH
jgi:DNA-binding transcriptional LysR family regulator